MEQFFAHVAAACEADAFLFDSFSNPSAQQIEERLEPFVATIRAAHPTTPLIFLQTEVRESRNFNDKIRKFEDDKRAASEAGMQRLLKQDKNIYFLNPGMPLGDDHDATVDGVHPSDLGHGRILEVIRPPDRQDPQKTRHPLIPPKYEKKLQRVVLQLFYSPVETV